MSINKPDVVQKTDLVVTSTAIENKVTAQDINEIVRASGDSIDAINELVDLAEDVAIAGAAFSGESNVVTVTNTTDFFPVSFSADVNPETSKFTYSNGVFTYTGERKRGFIASATLTLTSSPNNTIICCICKNGVAIPNSSSEAVTGSGGRSDTGFPRDIVTLEEGDQVAVRIRNTTGDNDVTVRNFNFIIEPIGFVILENGNV